MNTIHVNPIARRIIEQRIELYTKPGMIFYENLMRIPNIYRAIGFLRKALESTENMEQDDLKISSASDDILRSVVVFNYSSLETFLREFLKPHVKDAQTFSRIKEITKALEKSGIDPKYYEPYIPKINAMLKRRHNIAHEADRFGLDDQDLRPINLEEVNSWSVATVAFFISCIFGVLDTPKAKSEMNEQLNSKGQTNALITTKEINQVFTDRYPDWRIPS